MTLGGMAPDLMSSQAQPSRAHGNTFKLPLILQNGNIGLSSA